MQGFISLVGRMLLVAIFLASAIMSHILDFSNTTLLMQQQGVQYATVTHVGAIAFLLLGSISLILGVKARWGAALLAVFLALATYYFHDFWNMADAAQAQQEQVAFMKNLSMFGAMLFIMANGAGAWSIDACCHRRRCAEENSQPA
jgi:putative oxidoreductase